MRNVAVPTSSAKLTRVALLAAASCFLLATGARSQDKKAERLPMFFGLYSGTEINSSLTMTCDGSPPYERMTCIFISVSVRKPTKKEAEETLRELDSFLDGLSPSDFAEKRAKSCSDGAIESAVRQFESIKTEYPAMAGMAEAQLALCACKDVSCYRSRMRKALVLEQDVCSVTADTFQVAFQRVGRDRKWMNKPEPTGLCSMVTSIVIEESDGKWTYRQNRLAVDQTSAFCKNFEPQQQQLFSSEILSPGVTGCRVVQF